MNMPAGKGRKEGLFSFGSHVIVLLLTFIFGFVSIANALPRNEWDLGEDSKVEAPASPDQNENHTEGNNGEQKLGGTDGEEDGGHFSGSNRVTEVHSGTLMGDWEDYDAITPTKTLDSEDSDRSRGEDHRAEEGRIEEKTVESALDRMTVEVRILATTLYEVFRALKSRSTAILEATPVTTSKQYAKDIAQTRTEADVKEINNQYELKKGKPTDVTPVGEFVSEVPFRPENKPVEEFSLSVGQVNTTAVEVVEDPTCTLQGADAELYGTTPAGEFVSEVPFGPENKPVEESSLSVEQVNTTAVAVIEDPTCKPLSTDAGTSAKTARKLVSGNGILNSIRNLFSESGTTPAKESNPATVLEANPETASKRYAKDIAQTRTEADVKEVDYQYDLKKRKPADVTPVGEFVSEVPFGPENKPVEESSLPVEQVNTTVAAVVENSTCKLQGTDAGTSAKTARKLVSGNGILNSIRNLFSDKEETETVTQTDDTADAELYGTTPAGEFVSEVPFGLEDKPVEESSLSVGQVNTTAVAVIEAPTCKPLGTDAGTSAKTARKLVSGNGILNSIRNLFSESGTTPAKESNPATVLEANPETASKRYAKDIAQARTEADVKEINKQYELKKGKPTDVTPVGEFVSEVPFGPESNPAAVLEANPETASKRYAKDIAQTRTEADVKEVDYQYGLKKRKPADVTPVGEFVSEVPFGPESNPAAVLEANPETASKRYAKDIAQTRTEADVKEVDYQYGLKKRKPADVTPVGEFVSEVPFGPESNPAAVLEANPETASKRYAKDRAQTRTEADVKEVDYQYGLKKRKPADVTPVGEFVSEIPFGPESNPAAVLEANPETASKRYAKDIAQTRTEADVKEVDYQYGLKERKPADVTPVGEFVSEVPFGPESNPAAVLEANPETASKRYAKDIAQARTEADVKEVDYQYGLKKRKPADVTPVGEFVSEIPFGPESNPAAVLEANPETASKRYAKDIAQARTEADVKEVDYQYGLKKRKPADVTPVGEFVSEVPFGPESNPATVLEANPETASKRYAKDRAQTRTEADVKEVDYQYGLKKRKPADVTPVGEFVSEVPFGPESNPAAVLEANPETASKRYAKDIAQTRTEADVKEVDYQYGLKKRKPADVTPVGEFVSEVPYGPENKPVEESSLPVEQVNTTVAAVVENSTCKLQGADAGTSAKTARKLVNGNNILNSIRNLFSKEETENVTQTDGPEKRSTAETEEKHRQIHSTTDHFLPSKKGDIDEPAGETTVETAIANQQGNCDKGDAGDLSRDQAAEAAPSNLRKKETLVDEPADKATMETALVDPRRREKGDTGDAPVNQSTAKGEKEGRQARDQEWADHEKKEQQIKLGGNTQQERQADKNQSKGLGLKGEGGHPSDDKLFSSTAYGGGNKDPKNSWEELDPAGKTAEAPGKSSLGVMLDGFRRVVGLDNTSSLEEGQKQEAEQDRRNRNARDRFVHEKVIERARRYERSSFRGADDLRSDEELFSSTSYGGGNEDPRDNFDEEDSGLAGGPEKSARKKTVLENMIGNLKRAVGLGDTCSTDEEQEGVEIKLESTADTKTEGSEEQADSEETTAAQAQELHRSASAQASAAMESKKPEPVFDSQLVAALPATAVDVRNSTATQVFSGHHQAISDFRKGKKPGKNRTLQQVGEKQAKYTESGGLSLEVGGNYSYLRALGFRSDVNLADGLPGFRNRGFGFEAGLFHVFDTKLLAGMMMAGEHSKASLKGRSGNVDLDSLRLGPFFSWKPGNWYIDGALTVGQHDVKAKGRDSITGDKYKGNFGMSEWAGWLGTGYDIHLDKYVPNLTVTPMAEFLYLDTRLSNLGLNNQNNQNSHKVKVKGDSRHDRIDRYGMLSSYVVPGSGGNTEIHGGIGIQKSRTASHKVNMRHADASRDTREKRGKTDGRTKWFTVGVNQKLDASKNISFDLNSDRGNNSRSNGASATFEYKFK